MNTCYQFDIEEEYFLADATTRGTPRRTMSVRGRFPGPLAQQGDCECQTSARRTPALKHVEGTWM